MSRTLIDLSMPVHNDMVVSPRRQAGAGHCRPGRSSPSGSARQSMGPRRSQLHDRARRSRRHAHRLSPPHSRDRRRAEAIPIDYCYGDGVVLDFRHLPLGAGISVDDVKSALAKIDYTLKPLDIVLIHTGAGKLQDSEKYLTDQVGMTGEATDWMLDQGIKVMGIDAITFDPPIWAMFERRSSGKRIAMARREYYHLENMTNLHLLPPHGFKLSLFPISG